MDSSFAYSIYGFNQAELYFCLKTISFELSNDAKPFLFDALTVYGTSHLYENFVPFLSCLHLLSNNTLSSTLTFVEDRWQQSKSRFCFLVPFFVSPSSFLNVYSNRVCWSKHSSNTSCLKRPSYEVAGSEFSPYFKSMGSTGSRLYIK